MPNIGKGQALQRPGKAGGQSGSGGSAVPVCLSRGLAQIPKSASCPFGPPLAGKGHPG